MNGIKRTFALLSLTLFYCPALISQTTYQSAIGLRIGTGYYDLFSASYKTFLSSSASAIELDFGVKPATNYNTGCCVVEDNGNTMISFSASYQYHVPIVSLPGLQWFIGGGLALTNTFSDNSSYRGIGLGIFPTGGADYKFAKIPLAVSVDIRPTFRVASPAYYNYENFYFPDFGFSGRYTF
jgi:hypothetical protein